MKLIRNSRKDNKIYCKLCDAELVKIKTPFNSTLYVELNKELDLSKDLRTQGHFLNCANTVEYIKKVAAV